MAILSILPMILRSHTMRSPTQLLREIRSRRREPGTPSGPPLASEGATVSSLLGSRGWAAVYSHLLGEEVLFVRDEAVTLPPSAARLVSYTRAELEILSTATAGALRAVPRGKQT